MDVALYFLIAIVGMVILVKLFSWPLKILGKLILNGIFGVLLLLLVNFVGKYVGITIAINAGNCAYCRIFRSARSNIFNNFCYSNVILL